MDGHAGILQQGIQVAAVRRRRQQALEGVRGQQQEQDEADGDQAHHAECIGHGRQGQALAEGGHGNGPQRQDENPEQHRALVPAPDRRHLVEGRQQGVRVLRHIEHGEIVADEGGDQAAEGRAHRQKLRRRRRTGDAHQPRIATHGADNGDDALHQRHAERQDQGKLSEFRKHRNTPLPKHPPQPLPSSVFDLQF
jgi:hypothetical protein